MSQVKDHSMSIFLVQIIKINEMKKLKLTQPEKNVLDLL